MAVKEKYRRIEELYTEGKTVEAHGGVTFFVQMLNPFERGEARADAQAARTRHIMSYQEHGHSEREQLEAAFFAEGREGAIEKLLDLQMNLEMVKILDEIHDDPEWQERMEVMGRSDELLSRPPDDVERQFLDESNRLYVQEVQERMDAERQSQRRTLEQLSDAELKKRYSKAFLERRGDEAAMQEYMVTQLSYAVRDCDAVKKEDGSWDHSKCSHERIYSKEEARALPTGLYELLSNAMDNLNLSVREGKGLASPTTSSEPSASPNGEAASSSSTPEETSDGAPGHSKSRSTTRSRSSASTSSPKTSARRSRSG